MKGKDKMKRTACFIVMLGIISVFSYISGCGNGNEEPEIDLREIAKPQPDEAQDEVIPAAKSEAISEQAESFSGPEVLNVSSVSDEIIIENQGYETDRKKPVKLSHKRHSEEYNIACIRCHHVYQDGNNLWQEGDVVEKCANCHDPAKDQDDVMKLQTAYHNNCKECHKEVSQEGKEAPYKKCTDCHG